MKLSVKKLLKYFALVESCRAQRIRKESYKNKESELWENLNEIKI